MRGHVKSINFQDNTLGYKGISHFCNFLFDNNMKACTYLNLENNKIGDKGGSILLEAVGQMMKNLNTLILSKNDLSTNTGKQLANLIDDDHQLTQLDLHYNSFVGDDLLEFVNNINKFDKIEIIDLSWNQLGKSNELLNKLFEILSTNLKMLRLDISHNNITNTTDYQLWFDNLNKNHSLMGLSVTGNALRLDIDQYLRLPYTYKDNTYNLVQVQYENREISNMVKVRDKCMLTNNWAKEKWVPIDIKCNGKITDRMLKFIISDPEFKGNISNMNKNVAIDFDT